MKIFNIVAKVVVALAAVAGAVYVVATYGDKIVAWAKNLLGSCKCCQEACEDEAEVIEEVPAEEVVEEVAIEDAPAEEVVVEEGEPVAEEADFEA